MLKYIFNARFLKLTMHRRSNSLTVQSCVITVKMFELFSEILLQILGFYPSRYIVKVQALHVIQGLTVLIVNEVNFFTKRIRRNKPTVVDIFFLTDRLHKEILIAIQIYIFYRIYRYSNHKFYEKLSKYFKWKFDTKAQQKLHHRLILIIIVRIIKCIFYHQRAILNALIALSAEVTLATSDFIVVFFVENLNKKLYLIKYQIVNKIHPQKIHQKLIDHIKIERKFFDRFSVELFISITFNYIQLIHCLYWIFVRITHNRLREPVGEYEEMMIR